MYDYDHRTAYDRRRDGEELHVHLEDAVDLLERIQAYLKTTESGRNSPAYQTTLKLHSALREALKWSIHLAPPLSRMRKRR